ncbi:MAG: hypothetical protein LIO69_07870 [Oscillospiraceae bacterium]|nr:hypothetical protein [Oscillospiraceae bacterium]
MFSEKTFKIKTGLAQWVCTEPVFLIKYEKYRQANPIFYRKFSGKNQKAK